MPPVIEIIRKLEQIPPELKEIFILFLEEMERLKDFVTKKEFNELKEIVRELAEAQKRTEQRLEELVEAQKRTEQRVEELAEAQKRTERKVEELTEAQRRSEERISRLEQVVEELAEAQKRTEQRMEELAEVQRRSEERISRLEQVVEELAEAQKRTEEELRKLIAEHKETRKILGGLADTVGYGLEDKVFTYMERFAQSEFGVTVKDIGRKNIVYPDGKFDELNIYIEGQKNGQKIYLIGECKAQLGKSDIKKFSEKLERIKKFLKEQTLGFIVSYSIQPQVEEYLKKFHPEIRFYYSFYFDLKYKS